MKKVLSIVLALAMVLIVSPNVVALDEVTTTFELEKGSGTKDSIVELKIDVSDCPAIASAKLHLEFDDVFQIVGFYADVKDYAEESGLSGILVIDEESESETDKYDFPISESVDLAWQTTENLSGDFTAFTIRFKILDTAELKKYTITMTADEEDIFKNVGIDQVNIPFELVNGEIEVTDELRGDLNGDKIKDSDDAIYLLYHVFYYAVDGTYPVTQNCDFNKDGIVDSDDAIYLLYNVFYFEIDGTYPID